MGKFQFFTTDTDSKNSWFPIDHFFFARKLEEGQEEGPKVVHLETHASVRNASGMGVSIVSPAKDPAKNSNWEEFDDIPSALRRMADIIEAHNVAHPKVEMKPYKRYRTQGMLSNVDWCLREKRKVSAVYPNVIKRNQKRKLTLKPMSIWGWFVKLDG
jgi:hypothetical protein